MGHGVTRWVGALVVLGAGLGSGRAEAESGETNRTAAESLFVDAKRLMEAGQYAQACPKFADSQKIDPGVGTLLNLALCYEKQGRIASSWSTYREAAAAARSAGQGGRESLARQRAAALEPRLSRLTVALPASVAAADGVTVHLDGAAIPPTLWGVASPVDAGEHLIEVSANGKKPWSTRVQVVPPSNPAVAVPELEAAPSDAMATTATTSVEVTRTKSPQRTIALVAGGAGVLALGFGTFFGLSARSTYHGADSGCSASNVCSPDAKDQRDEAFNKATASTIAFAVGGVALAAGAVLWLTAPKDAAPQLGLAVSPRSVAMQGAW